MGNDYGPLFFFRGPKKEERPFFLCGTKNIHNSRFNVEILRGIFLLRRTSGSGRSGLAVSTLLQTG